MKPVTITIDGPAGSGKGTTARLLAEKLGYKYLDSGALYRALGVYLVEKGRDIQNIDTEITDVILDFGPDNHVRVNGLDYEAKIRNVEASVYASKLSSQRYPRELVIQAGRAIIVRDNYVLEGRDTGTVWFPEAQLKIYLTADASARAHRRWLELTAKGETVSEEEVLQQICERDNRDMNRSDGPLCKPKGAYEIDTTHLTIEEQVEKIYRIYINELNNV